MNVGACVCAATSSCLQATRDYCAGQQPDPAAVAATQTLGFSLDPGPAAAAAAAVGSGGSEPVAGGSSSSGVSVFNPLEDIVSSDLVLVMDKYTAADVLREVRVGGCVVGWLSRGMSRGHSPCGPSYSVPVPCVPSEL